MRYDGKIKNNILQYSFLLILILAITGIARPRSADVLIENSINVIDILLVIDISSSMLADDFQPNRLEAVKVTASQSNVKSIGWTAARRASQSRLDDTTRKLVVERLLLCSTTLPSHLAHRPSHSLRRSAAILAPPSARCVPPSPPSSKRPAAKSSAHKRTCRN